MGPIYTPCYQNHYRFYKYIIFKIDPQFDLNYYFYIEDKNIIKIIGSKTRFLYNGKIVVLRKIHFNFYHIGMDEKNNEEISFYF